MLILKKRKAGLVYIKNIIFVSIFKSRKTKCKDRGLLKLMKLAC